MEIINGEQNEKDNRVTEENECDHRRARKQRKANEYGSKEEEIKARNAYSK